MAEHRISGGDSSIARLTKADAVSALVAADVVEYGAKVDTRAREELARKAVNSAGDFFGDHGTMMRRAAESSAARYAKLDAGAAVLSAKAVLEELGVSLHDVRAFRGRVALGLTYLSLEELAAPQIGGAAGSSSYVDQEPAFAAIADRVSGAGRVTDADVAELTQLVRSLDLMTICDASPSLQDHFQMTFCHHAYETPQEKPITDLYWQALDGHRDLLEARAGRGEHITFDEGREKAIAIMTFAQSSALDRAQIDELKRTIDAIDPEAMNAARREDLAQIVHLVKHWAPQAFKTELDQYAKSLRGE